MTLLKAFLTRYCLYLEVALLSLLLTSIGLNTIWHYRIETLKSTNQTLVNANALLTSENARLLKTIDADRKAWSEEVRDLRNFYDKTRQIDYENLFNIDATTWEKNTHNGDTNKKPDEDAGFDHASYNRYIALQRQFCILFTSPECAVFENK